MTLSPATIACESAAEHPDNEVKAAIALKAGQRTDALKRALKDA